MSIAFHSDKALWLAFKKGDREALDNLFRSYYPLLFQYGLKIYPDQNYIEESLQDFFLYLYDRRKNLNQPNSIKSYLFTSYRRRLLRRLEKKRMEKKVFEEASRWQPDIQFSIDEVIINAEDSHFQKEFFVRILNKLSSRQREAIYLRYYNDLSIHEISDVLCITYQGTVNTLHRAIKNLRKSSYWEEWRKQIEVGG